MVGRKVVEGRAVLAARVGEPGPLRSVAHAAGISPTMADWRRVFTVDLVGTALPARTLRPLATEGTALVCFASMAPLLGGTDPDPAVDAVLDEPLDERFLDRVHDAVGPGIEDTGIAYAWAKRGVQECRSAPGTPSRYERRAARYAPPRVGRSGPRRDRPPGGRRCVRRRPDTSRPRVSSYKCT
ncbi:hypothetical protein ACIOHS_03600 [Streptomyces sp. NPDC088253]|uniref:hypothetical protein n=1 Tax=Streptomyces sp. NPDC088253 TaxID=3365846 RepID=UPI0038300453